MSNIGRASPYRAPCWGWSGLPAYFGGCSQHKVSAHSHIERKRNTTQVPACADSTPDDDPPCSAGTPQDPYSRTVSDVSNTVFCAANPCCCRPWEEPVPANTYASYDPPEYVDLSACYKYGFKNLYAIKQWHGQKSFTADDSCTEAGSRITTKYLTKTVTVNFTSTGGGGEDGTDPYEAEQDRTWNVGRYTGRVTLTDCVDTPEDDYVGWPYVGDFTTARDMVVAYLGVGHLVNPTYPDGLWTGIGATSGDPWLNVIAALNDPDYPTAINLTAGPDYAPWAVTAKSVSSTHLHFVFNVTNTQLLTVDITLSDPYTSSDLSDDIRSLLEYWDLCDDLTYPWRKDGHCTSGPLMSYYERSATVPDGNGSTGCSWTDAGTETGEILGAPTTPGYDAYFNFHQPVYHLDAGLWHQTGYGESAPSWAKHATQWTTLYQAAAFPPGAFAAFNTLTGITDALVVGCWAETIIPTWSHNFARPCGEHDIAARVAATQVCAGPDTTYEGDFLYPAAACYCNDTTQSREEDGTCAPAENPAATDQWNDVGRKGDFVVHIYTFDYRDACERSTDPETFGDPLLLGPLSGIEARQLCAGGSACRPFAIFITPINPSCPSMSWIEIPESGCDSVGSMWQALPRPWMADPLWQPPAEPCALIAGGLSWMEDDGSCLEDTMDTAYYPMRPWEESRATVPAGAPALPTGIFLDASALSVAAINDGATSADGVIWNPPAPGTCPNPMPWVIYQFQQDCIADNGRFSADYQQAAEDRTLDLPLI